jgi:hypothetical protein
MAAIVAADIVSIWTPFHSFWSSPWAAPLRGACIWLKRTPAPHVPPTPDKLAPDWIRPLCLQRWVGQAIAARLAWVRAHPDSAGFLYADETIPLWTQTAWWPYHREVLRSESEAWLLTRFQMEVECLLRIMQVPPALLGEEVWTRAALGSCERLAQVYHELRRRVGTSRARQVLREALSVYVTLEPPREAADSLADVFTRVGD